MTGSGPSGRGVLVTGASRGMGAAVARAFAAAGDRVAVHYAHREDAARDVLAGLAGSGHVLAAADLRDPAATRVMVDAAADRLGGLAVLVNNAVVFVAHPPLGTSYEDWQAAWADTLAVNLVGAANVTWCAVRHMPASGGRVVNVASRGAFRGEPDQPAYGASKAGLVAFAQSMARALGPVGIAVSTVAPGFTDTDMAAPALAGDGAARRAGESPLGRIARPQEVAAAVLDLASADAEMASGTVLDVNGASYLRI